MSRYFLLFRWEYSQFLIRKSPAFQPGLLVIIGYNVLDLVIGAIALLKVLITQAVHILTKQFSVVVIIDA